MTIDDSVADQADDAVSFEQILRAYNQAFAAPAATGEASLVPLYIPGLKLSGPRQYQLDHYVLDSRGRGLLVMVQAYAGMAPGDVLKVLDADTRVLLSAQVAKGWEDGHVSLFIPAEQLHPGPLQLTLEVTGAGPRRTSVPVSVEVVPRPIIFGVEPPPLPAPLVQAADGGVLDPLLGQVTLQVPGDGVFYGSYLILTWLFQSSTGALVSGQAGWDIQSSMAGRPITRVLDQALEPFSGGTLQVSYLVENPDWPMPKVSATLQVAIGTQPLALPEVPSAGGGALGVGALFSGFSVKVKAYPGMRLGDEVELQCTTLPPVGAPLLSSWMVLDDRVGKDADFTVSADHVRLHAGRQLSLTYTVWRYDGRAPVSGAVVLTVPALQPAYLPRLVVRLDTLDLDVFLGDLQLIAYPDEWLRVGLKYWIQVRGTAASGAALVIDLAVAQAITAAQVAAGITAVVTRANLERVLPGSVLTVALRLGMTQQTSIETPLLQLRILRTLPLVMDTSTRSQTTDSSYIILQGKVPLQPAAPNAVYARQASGGRQPYRYSSSNTAVAVVDAATGRVRAAGNGEAKITVTDQRGVSLSYTIRFAGVRLVRVEPNLWWPGNLADPVRKNVEKCLNSNELIQMWRHYRSQGPVGDVLGVGPMCWTNENILTGPVAWAFNLNSAQADQPTISKVSTGGGVKLPGFLHV